MKPENPGRKSVRGHQGRTQPGADGGQRVCPGSGWGKPPPPPGPLPRRSRARLRTGCPPPEDRTTSTLWGTRGVVSTLTDVSTKPPLTPNSALPAALREAAAACRPPLAPGPICCSARSLVMRTQRNAVWRGHGARGRGLPGGQSARSSRAQTLRPGRTAASRSTPRASARRAAHGCETKGRSLGEGSGKHHEGPAASVRSASEGLAKPAAACYARHAEKHFFTASLGRKKGPGQREAVAEGSCVRRGPRRAPDARSGCRAGSTAGFGPTRRRASADAPERHRPRAGRLAELPPLVWERGGPHAPCSPAAGRAACSRGGIR